LEIPVKVKAVKPYAGAFFLGLFSLLELLVLAIAVAADSSIDPVQPVPWFVWIAWLTFSVISISLAVAFVFVFKIRRIERLGSGNAFAGSAIRDPFFQTKDADRFPLVGSL